MTDTIILYDADKIAQVATGAETRETHPADASSIRIFFQAPEAERIARICSGKIIVAARPH
jgi:hypothetical protein